MDEQCKSCTQICKRLAPQDEPVHYLFSNLTAAQVMIVIEAAIQESELHVLRVKQSAQSTGPQLAVLMEAVNAPVSDNVFDQCLVFVIQAQSIDQGVTDMWIRYGTPENCCRQYVLVSELTALVTKVIDKLFEAEGSSASHNSKELEGVER